MEILESGLCLNSETFYGHMENLKFVDVPVVKDLMFLGFQKYVNFIAQFHGIVKLCVFKQYNFSISGT